MNKDTILTLIRTALTAVGAFFIGKSIGGEAIDQQLWQTILGIAMAMVSTAWGFFDKSTTLEGLQSVLRQVITFVGGFLIPSGKIKEELLEQIIGIVLPIATLIYSQLSKKKTANLVSGKFLAKTDVKGKDVVVNKVA